MILRQGWAAWDRPSDEKPFSAMFLNNLEHYLIINPNMHKKPLVVMVNQIRIIG